MADEMKEWIHVRVKCPNCGASVYVSWPPDDRADHLVKHGKCKTFRIGRKEALLQELANAVLEERVKSGPGLPGIRKAPGYRRMREQKRIGKGDSRDRGDGEE